MIPKYRIIKIDKKYALECNSGFPFYFSDKLDYFYTLEEAEKGWERYKESRKFEIIKNLK